MDKVFDRFARDEHGNALIDWSVLVAGMVLLAMSVVMTIAADTDEISDGATDRAASAEDWLPS